METLLELFEDQVQDLYNAENQLVKALPKMVKKASSPILKKGFEEHLAQTQQHVIRLEKVAQIVGFKPAGKKCKAMEGLVAEGKEILDEQGNPAVLDAGLIAAAQRVEHYEIAAYGTARALAELLGNKQAVKLLQQTLDEEKETDEKLTELALSEVNVEAAQAAEE